jgi:hypothetical protein
VFLKAKQLEQAERYAKYNDTPYSLEPNCKESPGGLRDLQVIQWVARAAGIGDDWKSLARAGLITAAEVRQFERADRFSPTCASNCTCSSAAARTACCSTTRKSWPRRWASRRHREPSAPPKS